MADRDGVVVDVEDDYDYDYDDPRRTVGELVRRSRLCFRDSDFAKIESVLTARENKLKEEIAACDGVNQRLNNELKNLERDKRKAESEAEKWKTHYQLLESRILSLEADAELLKTWKASFRVPGENGGNGVNVELENKVFDVDAADSEEYVNSAAAPARSVGLARQGSGRTPTKNIVEIIDSDDEFAPGGSLSEKKSTIQSFANTAHPDHASLQNATEMLKIKCDSNLNVSENEKNDGAVIGDTSSGDCHRNKLQKVIHVHSNPSVSENDKNDGAVIGDTSSGDCHRNKLQKVIHVHSNPSVSENDKSDGAVIGDTSSGDCHRNKLQKAIRVHSNPSVSENDKSDGAVIGDTSSGDCHRNKLQKAIRVHSNPSVSENDKNDGAVIGDTSSGDCHRNKLQKVIHVHSNPSVGENDKSDGAVIGDTSSGDCHRNKLQKVIHVHSNLSVSENDKNDGAVIGNTSSGDCHRNKLQKVIHVHSNLSVSENDKNDGAVIGNTSSGDCHRNKLQKVSHVNDGSPGNHTSATDNNFETYVTPSSHFPVTLRQCEEKMGAEHVTRNLLSEIFSGGSDDDDSSSSSSDSDDELMPNLELSQLIKQQDKKWEYGLEVIASLVTDDKLCLKAVCALYRKQISLGTSPRNLSSSSSGGFDCLDALRVSTLAKFLIDGDPQGRLKKSVAELLKFDRNGLDDCKRIAINHSKELLEIYKKKEDPEFHP